MLLTVSVKWWRKGRGKEGRKREKGWRGRRREGDRETDQRTQLVHEDFQGSRTQLVQKVVHTDGYTLLKGLTYCRLE